jgi:phosphatidylinositol glycan class V
MQSRPARSLIRCFVAWKLLLLLIAAGSPGPGYDTSTSLILPPPSSSNEDAPLPPALHYVFSKLTRWDAIYFVQAAHRGYRFEQEWAFGWGFSRLIAFVTASKLGTWPEIL